MLYNIYSLVDTGDIPKTPHPFEFDNNPISEYINTKRFFYQPNNKNKWKPFDYRYNYTKVAKKKYQPRPTKKKQQQQQKKQNKINKNKNKNDDNNDTDTNKRTKRKVARKPVGFYAASSTSTDSQDKDPVKRYKKYTVNTFIYIHNLFMS